MLSLAISMLTGAWAGSGPWILGPGQGTLYLGVESQRLNRLAIRVDGDRDVVDVGQGLSTFGVKAIGSLGLTSRFELQGTVPWWRVQANRADAPLCTQLGADVGREACETTTSVGTVELRGKGLLLDEFFGGPVSLAIGGEVRAGDFTMATRERLTNVGEGGLDTGAFVSLGRTGAVGRRGYWSGYVEVLGRYRFPVTRNLPPRLGERSVPGSEFTATGEWVISPRSRIAFGPLVTMLWRPFGVDWGDVDLTDQDRLGALRVFNARVGATFAVRGPGAVVATASVLHTAAAVNNPVDVLAVTAGVQAPFGNRRRTDADE